MGGPLFSGDTAVWEAAPSACLLSGALRPRIAGRPNSQGNYP